MIAVVLAACAADPTIGARCESCHASETRSYRETGMARALGRIELGELRGLAETPDANTGFAYRFLQDGERAALVETWNDPRGEMPPSSDASALEFAIGAGILDRSFAARRGRLLFFAPLEVVRDPESGERSATLSPGHAMRPATRYTIPIAEECWRCHTTSPPPRDYPLNLAPDSSWRPAGIDCGGCHARADEHALWREREKAGKQADSSDPGLVATFGDPIESVSVCARCHLQGDANLALRTPDRGLPAPGGDLLDERAVFVAATPTDEIGFVSHVERLALSACFRESLSSARALTCVTCHTPHRTVFESNERSRARAACLSCHADETSGASNSKPCSLARPERGTADCASCHMRATRVFDVDRVVVHDHWIQKSPPAPSKPAPLRAKESKDGALALFEWPAHAPRAHATDPGLWFMAEVALGRPDLARKRAAQAPLARAASLPMYFHLLGSLREREGRFDDAIRAYEKALAIQPELDESLVNLGGALTSARKPNEAIELLTSVIQRRPLAEGALRNRAIARLALRDASGFAADLEAALAIHPQAAIARALAQHYRQAQQPDRAAEFDARARALDPSFRP